MNATACRSCGRPQIGESRIELTDPRAPGSVSGVRILLNADDPLNADRFHSAHEGEDRCAAVRRFRSAGQRA